MRQIDVYVGSIQLLRLMPHDVVLCVNGSLGFSLFLRLSFATFYADIPVIQIYGNEPLPTGNAGSILTET